MTKSLCFLIIVFLTTTVSLVDAQYCIDSDGDIEYCDNGCCSGGCCWSIASIVGAVIGGIILLIIVVSFVVCLCCMTHKKGQPGSVQPMHNTNPVFVANTQQSHQPPGYSPNVGSNPPPPAYSNYGAYPPAGSGTNYNDSAYPPGSNTNPPPAFAYNSNPQNTGNTFNTKFQS